MVLSKLKRHLIEKSTWSDHDSIHGHRNLNEIERAVIARYRNFNPPNIFKLQLLWYVHGNVTLADVSLKKEKKI